MKNRQSFFFIFLMFPYLINAQSPCKMADPVSEVNHQPYSSIAYIQISKKRTTFTGTAFLIAPRILLTSAHNLADAKKISVSFAHNGTGINPPASSIKLTPKKGVNCFWPDAFLLSERKRMRRGVRHYDYAIIVLDKPASITSAFSLKPTTYDELNNLDIECSGYPGGISTFNNELYQLHGSSKVKGQSENKTLLHYTTGMRKGASGSPVFIHPAQDTLQEYQLVGIHGYGDGCNDDYGVIITADVINQINLWRRMLGL